MTQMEMDVRAYELGMNPEQLAAIRHERGPCKLLACAGSGKTRALVNRIARLVATGVDPRRILAVTFSRKAAEEMNARLRGLGIDGVRVGTWHSLCLEILQSQDDPSPWALWEVDDRERNIGLLREAIGHNYLDWKDADFGEVRRFVGLCKANLLEPDIVDCAATAESVFDTCDERTIELAVDAYTIFNALVEERALLTFDDFLVKTVAHLQSEESVRRRWASRWDQVLVDECQDDNFAQKVLKHLLARDHRNLFVVGDLAQSIYQFRGANPQYLHFFEHHDWTDARVLVMHRNYRSGSEIVRLANDVIRPAKLRMPVDMVAERDAPGSVEVRACLNADAEAQEFADWARRLMVEEGQEPESILCLVRTNAQTRAVEEALLQRRMPHVVVGGRSFYARKEVRDLVSYLKVAAGRDEDGEDVAHCINSPFRFLGKAFVEKVGQRARAARKGSWTDVVLEVAQSPGSRIQKRQLDSAQEWASIVRSIQQQIASTERDECRPANILLRVVHRTKYIEWLARDQGDESPDDAHGANVHELLRVSERFDTVEEMLDFVEDNERAARRQRSDKRGGGQRIVLMTIHKSKGLEADNVWVAGCADGMIPHYAAVDLEEERRILYVAVTRARDRLVCSYARQQSRRDGVRPDAGASRFLAGWAKKDEPTEEVDDGDA
jgi:DNA helicase-2/ATP-dependent DNA helicase PcrA